MLSLVKIRRSIASATLIGLVHGVAPAYTLAKPAGSRITSYGLYDMAREA